MMDGQLPRQAALYALEALPAAERAEFEAALDRNPELQSLVASLRAIRDAVAGAVPPTHPPAHVKQRLLAEIDARHMQTAPKPAPASGSNFAGFWLPWSITAVVVVLAVNWRMDKGDLKKLVLREHSRIEELNQIADNLRASTNTLQQTVVTQNATKMDDLRVGLLGSPLTDFPKPIAVCLWDGQQQAGLLMAQYLPPLTPDRDYQLWIIDPQYLAPVSAGVFQVDALGAARIHFKTDKAIGTARQFTVTSEAKGGAAAPTFKNMVLVGG
jgi:anti-sigma-K factor RskA